MPQLNGTGFSEKEIARKLNICNSTVDFHRTKLYGKLGVHSIDELFDKYKSTPPREPQPLMLENLTPS